MTQNGPCNKSFYRHNYHKEDLGMSGHRGLLKFDVGRAPDMSNVIEGAIDIDFLEVLTLTIDIELTILESLTLPLTLRLVNDCMQLLTLTLTLRSQLLTLL